MQTNLYRKIFGMVACASLALVLMLASGCSQSGESFKVDRKTVNGLPTVTATGTSWADVKVDDVDYAKRTVTLNGGDGKPETFAVGPEVRNFAQVKKGDVVKVAYMDELVVNVHKVNEPPAVAEVAAMSLAPLGDKPGILATRTVEIQTNVVGIDYAARLVTLKSEDGKVITLTASPKLKDLDKVQKGDQVVFTYSEAISIQVTKP